MSKITIDEVWEDWKPGDFIIWEEDRQRFHRGEIQPFTITSLSQGYVYWNDPISGEENMTRETNMLRIVREEA